MRPNAAASRVLVIGVGNPYRRDDGAGIVVLERLRAGEVPGIEIVESSGDPAALIDAWTGYSPVVLVDAVDSDSAAGTIHRFECVGGEWRTEPGRSSTSSHGLGIAEAVELGRVLERLPERLVFFGIEVADDGDGVGLSPPVAEAVDAVVHQIGAEVHAAVELQR